jgi:hypothetical protein
VVPFHDEGLGQQYTPLSPEHISLGLFQPAGRPLMDGQEVRVNPGRSAFWDF